MSALLNKFLLIMLILPLLLQEPVTLPLVAAFVTALILGSLGSYFEDQRKQWLCILYCTTAFLWSPLFPFLSLAAYDCFGQKAMWIRIIWLLPLLKNLPGTSPYIVFSSAALCVLAILLAHRTFQYEELLTRYHQVRDDITETALLLQSRNKELQKRQNYEVELATLAERNRIAREIHDNVGHLLTRSILQVSALQVVHKENPIVTEQLSAVKETLTDAMNNVRSSVHNLHEDTRNLKQQLSRIIGSFTFCPVNLTFDCSFMPKEMEYAVLAIVKEGLSNIARHSNATQAEISLIEHPSLYQLTIQDNGTGKASAAPPSGNTARQGSSRSDTARSTAASPAPGLGLSSMKERILAFDGIFHTDTSSGFKIFISIPKGGTHNETDPY